MITTKSSILRNKFCSLRQNTTGRLEQWLNTSLWEQREVWGSFSWPVKSDTVAIVLRSYVAQALNRGDSSHQS